MEGLRLSLEDDRSELELYQANLKELYKKRDSISERIRLLEQLIASVTGAPPKRTIKLVEAIREHIKENGPSMPDEIIKAMIDGDKIAARRDPPAQVKKSIKVAIKAGTLRKMSNGKIAIND